MGVKTPAFLPTLFSWPSVPDSVGSGALEEPMRHIALLIAIALPLCLTGCSEDPKERLQGKWEGKSVSNVEGPQEIEATAWAQGVRFEFDESEMTVAIPSEKPRTGDFDIEDVEDDEVKVQVAREGGETDSVVFTFDDDELKWSIGDGRHVVLARAD